MTYLVSYIRDGKVAEKVFPTAEEAVKAYEKIGKADRRLPRKASVVNDNGSEVVLSENNWYSSQQGRAAEAEETFKANAKVALTEAGIRPDRIDKILSVNVEALKRAVRANEAEALMALPGIGKATVQKAFAALWPLCRKVSAKVIGSYELPRVSLQLPDSNGNCFKVDTIKKTLSGLERKALELGGPNAIIECVSLLAADNKMKEQRKVALQVWDQTCKKGLMLGNNIYTFLGHGTNAAKMCKTIWVKKEIYAQMREFMLAGTDPEWETTTAKKLAYLSGLQLVATESTGMPFQPEDFYFFPSVFSNTKGKFVKVGADGSRTELPADHEERIIRSDGYFCIDIDESMKSIFVQRLIAKGMSKRAAEERVGAFCADTATASYRCAGVAFKGCGSKRFRAHKFLAANGITKTPDGRDVAKISVFCDETTLKTKIGGKGAAYPTFGAWADAVRERLNLGVCVKTHAMVPKPVPYQVTQCITEATEEQVEKMAEPTIQFIKEASKASAAYKLLGSELGHVASIFPGIMAKASINMAANKKVEKLRKQAFSGKLLNGSYYSFLLPDEVLVFQGWFGLPMTGCLEAGEFNMSSIELGETVMWRNPILHPGSVKVMKNVKIKEEFRQFFKAETGDIMLNGKDASTVDFAADFDGDHGSVSQLEPLVDAVKLNAAKWDYTVIWDTPKTPKKTVSREDEIDYVKGLTDGNELGLTVFHLNALLNRIVENKDKSREIIPVSHHGVDFACFAGNVLVDASKHGGMEVKRPKEFNKSGSMVQPLAVQYRKTVNGDFTDEEKAEKCQALINEGKAVSHPAGTLDKLFSVYAKKMYTGELINDVQDDFDFHNLMFDPEEGLRGLTGLISFGKQTFVKVDGETIRPDQGCFNAIANRLAALERQKLKAESYKDKTDKSYRKDFRVNALAEIEAFANAAGKTLEDAYDVITLRLFGSRTNKNDKYAFLSDRLWKAYWTVFGGMAERAAMRWEKSDSFDSDNVMDIDEDETDQDDIVDNVEE